MANTDVDRLAIREYPIWIWLSGLVTCLTGAYVSRGSNGLVPGVITILIGLLLVLVIAHIVFIDADRNDGCLRIRYVSALHRQQKELPVNDIAAVEVESSSSKEGGNAYRVVFRLHSGEIVPLYSFFSAGYRSKEKRARRLSEFLEVSGPTPEPVSPLQWFGQAFQGSFNVIEEGVTSDVRWQMESGVYGVSPVTRWSSPDFMFPNGFCLLAQKPEAMKDFSGGGLFKPVTELLYRQMLNMYGFTADDTPGVESARMMALDGDLGKHYFAFTSDPQAARRLLSPWAQTLLSQWAGYSPLKIAGDPALAQGGQLVVLYSPSKLYVAIFHSLDPRQQQTLIDLGVDLVRQSGDVATFFS